MRVALVAPSAVTSWLGTSTVPGAGLATVTWAAWDCAPSALTKMLADPSPTRARASPVVVTITSAGFSDSQRRASGTGAWLGPTTSATNW